MFEEHAGDTPIEVGIISFKNLKSGFLPFGFKEEKDLDITVSKTILNSYIEEIVVLLNEILDINIPFEEKI
ncbi:hypothetical protein D3C86_2159220 [compost metagenome]